MSSSSPPKPSRRATRAFPVFQALFFAGIVLALSLYGLHCFGLINAWYWPLKHMAALWLGSLFASGVWSIGRSLRRSPKRLKIVLISALVFLNLPSFAGAYALTHFCPPGQLGIGMPRPVNHILPSNVGLDYVTEKISLNKWEWLETWRIPASYQPSRGTVLLFPGNGGVKGKQLLAPAQAFHRLGYDAVLVDFRGVGGSSGNTTTLGVREAKDVARMMEYIQDSNGTTPVILYGVSMGTAAILKAIAHHHIQPDAIILELPFVRLLDSVKRRLAAISLPTSPLAELVVFWGSVQHGFNGFTHNPIAYARQVTCPTLVLQGDRDKWISDSDIQALVQQVSAPKQLTLFPNTGHQLLITVDSHFWSLTVQEFLQNHIS